MKTLFVMLLAAVSLDAQTGRLLDTNLNSWWIYTGDHPIHGPWGVYAEVQARRSDFASIWQQLQLRDAATYRVNRRMQLSAGYVWTRTARYGGFPAAQPALEHRAYQRLTWRQAGQHVDFDHRFQLEQRWIQNYTGTSRYFWRYQDRFRYQIKASVPVTDRWYVFGADEILIHFGPNHGSTAFDQNRANLGWGLKVNKANRFETSYMHQYLLQRNGWIAESNHTLRVQWTSTVPFSRRR